MRRGSFIVAIATAAVAIPLSAFGAVSVKTTMARAELVIPDISPEQAISAVHDGMAGWLESLPISRQPLPDPLPARPDKPTTKQIPLGPAKATGLDCATAAAEIVKQSAPTKTQMAFNQDIFQGCVYPFEKGVKVYLQAVNIDAADSSITAGLFSGIANTIRGTPGEWLNRRINDMIAKVREKAPTVLVERIEAPGVPTQQPDKDAVLALIPPEQEKPATVAVPVAPVSLPTQAQTFAPVPAVDSSMAMIEARKNLHGMGLVYHSQEQFRDAIRRKDELAVKLFVQAGGVDVAEQDAHGKSAIDLARETGSVDITKLLEPNSAPRTAITSPPPTHPVKDASPAVVAGQLTQEEQIARVRQLIQQQMQKAGQ